MNTTESLAISPQKALKRRRHSCYPRIQSTTSEHDIKLSIMKPTDVLLMDQLRIADSVMIIQSGCTYLKSYSLKCIQTALLFDGVGEFRRSNKQWIKMGRLHLLVGSACF